MSDLKTHSQVPASGNASRSKKASARASDKLKSTKLAPDGLPWPKGYFDSPVRQSLEEAVEMYGVRPTEYYKGGPCYSAEETARPEYKGKLPEEPAELQEQWRKEWAEWEAKGRPDKFSAKP